MKRALAVVLVAAAAAFCWWEGGLRQSSTAAQLGVLATIALALVTAVVAGAGRQATTAGAWIQGPLRVRRHFGETPHATVAVVIWIALVASVIGWDLNSFVHQSHDLPTLSSIVGHVTSSRPGRSVVVALWLTLGAALTVGWRRSR